MGTSSESAPRSSWAASVRTLGNWVNLSTPLGLLVARLGGCRLERADSQGATGRKGGTVASRRRGLWLASGYRYGFPAAGAFTIGSVVVSRHDLTGLARTHPGLLDHEEAHAWQWFALLGLPFLPAYLVAMAWSWWRTGDRASANVFEVRAGLESGGYTRSATRRSRRRPGRPLARTGRQRSDKRRAERAR